MRKKLIMVFTILVCIAFIGACGGNGQKEEAAPAEAKATSAEAADEAVTEKKGILMMATTTSTADTGLLDYLAELFLKDTGWELQYIAVGTGEALETGRSGEADIVLVHAKASEEEFVAQEYGVERIPVMYNDFVVIGPPGKTAAGSNIEAIFKQVLADRLPFVSRGDDSGTDKKEKEIWKALELQPEDNPNYLESGQGMGATLTMADEKQAFCLTDRGTWLKQKTDGDLQPELEIVCEGDSSLLNQYGVIAVNPEKYPAANKEAADDFITWICSEDVQELIGRFGVEDYGAALFTPNAGTDS